METKNSILLIVLISMLAWYIKYNEDQLFGSSVHLNEIGLKNKEFTLIESELPLGHIIKLNDNFLLCSGMNYPEIYITKEYLSNDLDNGYIYSYNIEKKNLEKIELDNFPVKMSFHPHGLSLIQIDSNSYYLYVINHLIKEDPVKNEEKIEKFQLKINKDKITLYYKNSYNLHQQYFGTLNSIAAINEKVIYFTTENYFSLPCYSENDESYYKYLNIVKFKLYEWTNIIFQRLNRKKTYLYSYDCETEEINYIYNSEGISNKGLAYDSKKSLLFMVRTFEKDIKVFEISRNIQTNALLIKTIKTIYNMGNIYYDNKNEKLYGGIYGSINELKELDSSYINNENYDSVSTFGGYEEIDPQRNYEISDLVLFKNELKGITSAIKINKDIFFSSLYEKGLLIYKEK